MVIIVLGGATLRNLAAGGAKVPTFLPELQGLCPIGAIQTISRIFTDPAYVFGTTRANIWVLAGVLAVSVLFGAVFCGRLCPLGTIQEWGGKLGRRVLGKKYNSYTNPKLDRAAAWLRFGAIAFVFAAVAGWYAIDLDRVNPSLALSHSWTAAVPVTAVLVLVIVFIASFFVERPWCRWLCPYGAVQGTVARLSPWTIRRDEQRCISCGKCDRACPLGVRVASVSAVRDDRCNRCTVCIGVCPVDGALSYSAGSHHTRFRSGLIVSIVAVVLFAAPLATARAVGAYSPGGSAASIAPEAFLPESITPMMSLDELIQASNIDEHELLTLLGLPLNFDTTTLLFDIEDEPEYEHVTVGSIREILVEFFAR